MRIVFLGTGTSTGVPLIGCKCRVCSSSDPRNKRSRTSVFVEEKGRKFLIDVTPDFRQQALNNGITELDAVLITHSHADHINGFDDIRQINFSMNSRIIPVFVNRTSYWEIQSRFDYVFRDLPQLGGGKPMVSFNVIDDYDKLIIGGVEVLSFFYYHGRLKVNGYRIGNFSYITDVSFIPKKTIEFIEGTEVLVISALRYLPHATHFTVSEVKHLVKVVRPRITYLTHMGHELDYVELYNYLEGSGILPAYDGLVVEV
ncbi:MAG: MBL fold metallo-hydrolase [Brevinematia bacterium]